MIRSVYSDINRNRHILRTVYDTGNSILNSRSEGSSRARTVVSVRALVCCMSGRNKDESNDGKYAPCRTKNWNKGNEMIIHRDIPLINAPLYVLPVIFTCSTFSMQRISKLLLLHFMHCMWVWGVDPSRFQRIPYRHLFAFRVYTQESYIHAIGGGGYAHHFLLAFVVWPLTTR